MIDREGLPLTYGDLGAYDDPETSDVLMARFHPAPDKTTVSLGMWGEADNLRAVDIECYIDPIGRRVSEFETGLCGVLMALVLKVTVPEWTERNDWLLSAVAAGVTTRDVIRNVGDARGERGLRYFASSYALGLQVSARPPPVPESGGPAR